MLARLAPVLRGTRATVTMHPAWVTARSTPARRSFCTEPSIKRHIHVSASNLFMTAIRTTRLHLAAVASISAVAILTCGTSECDASSPLGSITATEMTLDVEKHLDASLLRGHPNAYFKQRAKCAFSKGAIVTVSWRDEDGRRVFHYDEVLTGRQLIAAFGLPMGIRERYEEEIQEPWMQMSWRALADCGLAPKRTYVYYSEKLFAADIFRDPKFEEQAMKEEVGRRIQIEITIIDRVS